MYKPNGTPTDEQEDVIFYNFDDPLLVVAGAGAGKTYSATERLGHAVYDGILRPEDILVVSFTNKAVNEIVGRLVDNVGDIVENVQGKTIHAFCRWLVVTNFKDRLSGRHNGPTWENVLTPPLQKIVAQAICENEKLPFGPGYLLRWIQDAKKERIDPKMAYGWYRDELMVNGLEQWQAIKVARQLETGSIWYEDVRTDPYCLGSDYVLGRMQKARNGGNVWLRGGWLDFTDMILMAEEVLKDAEARRWFQERIKYVIVDEAQDTGPEMMSVLETVARPCDGVPPRMTAVGDAKQSIFRFRGAVPDDILYGWLVRHGETADVKFMTVNWRSENSRIVDAANYMARHSDPVYNKPMTPRHDSAPGATITYTFFPDTTSEAEHVVSTIADYIDDEKVKPGHCAIIYRTNAQSRAFEDKLLRRGIPYVVVNATGFFERKVVKDCLAFLRLMENPDDMDSLFRIRNMPSRRRMEASDKTTRYMGPKYFSDLGSRANQLRKLPRERIRALSPWHDTEYSYAYLALKEKASRMPDWKAANTFDLIEQMEMLFELADGEVSPAQALITIYDHTYIPWVRRREGLFEDAGADADPIFETLDELVDIASRYPTVAKFLGYVTASQKAMKDLGVSNNTDGDNQGRVVLLTGHKAKGLEWPVVFVVGVSDGLVPHIMSKPGVKVVSQKGDLPVRNKPDLVAEQNWLYVAVTRGEKETHISGPSVYRGRICPPTDWVLELVGAGYAERMAGERPGFADVVEVLTSCDPDEVEHTDRYAILRVGSDMLFLDVETSEPIAAFWNNMFVASKVGQFLDTNELAESSLYKRVRGL